MPVLSKGALRIDYIAEGGHMAPLVLPEIVNPIVREFLDAGSA